MLATGTVALTAATGAALAATFGKLKFQQAKFDGQGGVTGLSDPWDVVVSADGRSVYVSGDSDNTLLTFERNRRSGKLKFVNKKVDGQGGVDGIAAAQGLAASPDSRNVYVAGEGDDAIATFKRNRRTGKLKFVNAKFDGQGGVDGLEGTEDVEVSSNGRNAYVTGFDENALATFKRNRRTGKLKFVNAKFDGQGGVDGLEGAFEVAASADGKSVYVASETDAAVATFRRNGRTGRLTFVNAKFDGQGGALLSDATGLQVSPDDRSVYVSAAGDNAVDTFKRSRRTGRLKFVNAKVDGLGGVDGLAGTFDLTVAPDGHNVYASGFDEAAVATFKRSRRSGKLHFVNAKFDGQGGIDGLLGAYLMASSPNGRSVYVTGNDDASVVTFKRHR